MEEHTGERLKHQPFTEILISQRVYFHFPPKSHLIFQKPSCLLFQFTLGGFERLQSIKVRKREELGLPPLPEDSIRVIRSMRAASPPASASDLIEQQQKRARREHKVVIAATIRLKPAISKTPQSEQHCSHKLVLVCTMDCVQQHTLYSTHSLFVQTKLTNPGTRARARRR